MKLNKTDIANLLPHREPMLLVDELYDIKKLESATAVVKVKKDSFFVHRSFPWSTRNAWSINCRVFWSSCCSFNCTWT